MEIYRMHRGARAVANYSGAMYAGGHWNPIGTPMLYAAQHFSLACVEILVHLDKSELPSDYVWSSSELQGTPKFLPFSDLNHISSCQSAGHSWVAYRRTTGRTGAISEVPSGNIRSRVCTLGLESKRCPNGNC
jgi:hypothetical protein